MFQIGVIQLPGSNCERETRLAIERANMQPVDIFWYDDTKQLNNYDGFIIIGGFSYEDRCRSGAIAALDPIIQALIIEAKKGKPVLGICNGAQILVESGLVPGCINHQNQLTPAIALAHNRRIKDGHVVGTGFYNTWCDIQSEESPILHIPLAHAEGRFIIPKEIGTLLKNENVTTWHYVNENPNGSDENLAAIGNFSGNVLAIMPHPERTPNGDYIFQQMHQYLKKRKPFQWITHVRRNESCLDTKTQLIASNQQKYFIKLNITDNEAISVEIALQQHNIPVTVKKFEYWEIDASSNDLKTIEQSYELWNSQKQTALTTLPNQANTTNLFIFDNDDTLAQQKFEIFTGHYQLHSLKSLKRGKVWQLAGDVSAIQKALDNSLLYNPISQTALLQKPAPIKTGKVREIYEDNGSLLIKTTDRMTAFDRYLCDIPNKGAVLTQLSAWWFEQTRHIISNHYLGLVNENTMRVIKCKPIPIEVVVRGYLTGSTNTSIWTLYEEGERQFFETILPEHLQKNDPLPTPIVTPTTKSNSHDQPLTPNTITELIDYSTWEQIKKSALALFNYGQKIAKAHGFALVDTKYEFGFDEQNNLCLIDECHTPDSSRFWKLNSNDSYDKEFLRLWYRDHCDPYHDKTLPTPPHSLIAEMAKRYCALHKSLTNQPLRINACVESLVS